MTKIGIENIWSDDWRLSVFVPIPIVFDTVALDILWNDIHKMGLPTHIILLIKALCDQNKTAVRTSYGLTE